MMIRHHHRHAKRSGIIDLRSGRNPVIACQNRIDSRLMRLRDHTVIHSVTVMNTMRNHSVHDRAQKIQSRVQDIGGTYSVNIIIPNDTYRQLMRNLVLQNADRLLYILQQPRIIHLRGRTV